jgi:peptidoglycan-N-acetylglucosamine deacetylase
MTSPPWTWPESDWRALVNRVRAGRSLRPKTWPGGAKVGVALSFDADHETFEMGGGGRAIGRLAWGEYGRRVAMPRILALLARHDVRATVFSPAVAALIDPEEARRIVDHGHEVGVHGFIHENTSLLDRATERDVMLRAADTLERLAGRRPVGHRAAQWDTSPNTVELCAELGFLYDSSLMADDDPYELLLDGRPTGVVEIPVEWLRDDAVYLLFNRNPPTRPWTSPDEVLAIFRREFDGALAEGGLFQLVMHPFVIGYRSRLFILDEIIRHAKAAGAWFGTHEEVARWCLAEGRADG